MACLYYILFFAETPLFKSAYIERSALNTLKMQHIVQ